MAARVQNGRLSRHVPEPSLVVAQKSGTSFSEYRLVVLVSMTFSRQFFSTSMVIVVFSVSRSQRYTT